MNIEEFPVHGCWDCGNFDGSDCTHPLSGYCGKCPDLAAEDCGEWEGEL